MFDWDASAQSQACFYSPGPNDLKRIVIAFKAYHTIRLSHRDVVTEAISSDNFDISLLDQIVGAAYDPVSPHRAQANKALMQLQESPELWRTADKIIEQSQNPNSRFFGLQVLDDAIKTRCAN